MSRQAISAEKLHALLVREYQEARVVDCVTRCPMPKPVFRDAGAEDFANWHVQPVLKCPRHCHRIIADIAARIGATYDMESPSGIAA